ncbi:CpaD family pilus assembly protein [Salinarimonas ramus]|uniref:Pilus assembly protein n=1 Tax=Salinarimonas ramus TaxID=690164 RepID=A0A917V3W4_9HYPH|nr:CpaD family pilus assembly protein [Salinarimonas ramus]GGK32846.1 pilus assembly protein [Salinarimonas ramus]
MAPTSRASAGRASARTTRLARLACAGALAAALGACADRVVETGSTGYPHDYRERHPIALQQSPEVLDVLVRGVGLDPRQRADVAAFAAGYREGASGALHVQVPQGGDEVGTRRTLDAVRATLHDSGVPATYLSISTYTPGDRNVAAAIRLSYRSLQARVQSRCGLWPQDLGVSDAAVNIRNEQHWNFGCAMQTNVAAQVADPVDLVRGRTRGSIDVNARTPDIEAVREAESPATSFDD